MKWAAWVRGDAGANKKPPSRGTRPEWEEGERREEREVCLEGVGQADTAINVGVNSFVG